MDATNHFNSAPVWCLNFSNQRFSSGTLYLHNFLKWFKTCLNLYLEYQPIIMTVPLLY
jgi:hypothetical protein